MNLLSIQIFRIELASSPDLHNRCTIDWIGDFIREGLYQVANKLTEFVECKVFNFTNKIYE